MIKIYLILINLICMYCMYIDKKRAIEGSWRIPEKNLFLLAALGGSLGGCAGMYMFRHKTKKLRFVIGFPSMLIVHIVLTAAYCRYFG